MAFYSLFAFLQGSFIHKKNTGGMILIFLRLFFTVKEKPGQKIIFDRAPKK